MNLIYKLQTNDIAIWALTLQKYNDYKQYYILIP